MIEGDTAVEYFVVEAQQYLIPERFYIAARYGEAGIDGITSKISVKF